LKKKRQGIRSERNLSGSLDISCKTTKKRSRQSYAMQCGFNYAARCNEIIFLFIILLHPINNIRLLER
jgi:hypothetical protein